MTTNIHLACSTLIYKDLQLFEALELLVADGFKRVDMCIVPGFCPHFDLENYDRSDVERLKKKLSLHGISLVSLNVFPGYFNDNDFIRVSRIVRRSVQLAEQLRVKVVTLPAGKRVHTDQWEHSVDEVRMRLTEAADYAEQRGVVISIEAPHWGTLVENIEEAVRFFEKIDSRIKCTFDTSHVFRGERSSLYEGLKRIGSQRVNHIHIRDARGEEISFTPGKGNADFARLFDQLRVSNYCGYLCLELEFEKLTVKQIRCEVRFAKQYIENLLLWGKLPFPIKVQTNGIFQFFERSFRDPKQEIKRHPRLILPIRKIKAYIRRLLPIRSYDGYWRNKWYLFNRGKIVIQPVGSISTQDRPSQDICVCIHGCGYAGKMHAFGFQRLSGVKVLGVCDIDVSKSKFMANKLGCNSYTALEEMVEKLHPDLVAVCTREWQHYEAVDWLLNNGVDVFCEKILTTRYLEAQHLVNLAREKKRILGVNYNYRFISGVRKIKEVIRSQLFGALQLLNIRVHAFSYHHALDLVCFLGGDITSIQGIYADDNNLRDFGGTDWRLYDSDILYVPSRNLAATFELSSGAVAVITSSCSGSTAEFVLAVDAVFEKGAMALTGINAFDVVGTLSWSSPTAKLNKEVQLNHRKGVFARGYEYCFYKSIESFMNNYICDEQPETPGDQGLYVMLLEKAISASKSEGRKIQLGK